MALPLMFAERKRRFTSTHALPIIAAVLSAIVLLPAAFAATQDQFLNAKNSYARADYANTIEILESQLTQQPGDNRSRLLMSAALLRLNRRDLAEQQVSEMTTESDGRRYLTALQQLLSKYDSRHAAVKSFTDAMHRRDQAEALAAVPKVAESDLDRAILSAYVAAYVGDFPTAQSLLESAKTLKFRDRQRTDELAAAFREREESYTSALSRTDKVLFSGIAPSAWELYMPGMDRALVENYLADVRLLAELVPLSSRVMDLQFHAAMMTAEYDTVERTGRAVITAKGEVRLPGYGQSAYMELVIDGKNRRLAAIELDRAFNPSLVCRRMGSQPCYRKWAPSTVNGLTLKKQVPFDVSFNEVTSLSQDAIGLLLAATGPVLRNGDYALTVNRFGVFPMWSLMNVVHHLYGPEAQLRATQNLGKFIVSVVGKPIEAKLADPTKVRRGGIGQVLTAFAVVAGAAGQQGLLGSDPTTLNLAANMSQMASRSLAENERTLADATSRRKTWDSIVAEVAFDFSKAGIFAEVEALLSENH